MPSMDKLKRIGQGLSFAEHQIRVIKNATCAVNLKVLLSSFQVGKNLY